METIRNGNRRNPPDCSGPRQACVAQLIAMGNLRVSTALILAAWLKRPDFHPSMFLDTLSLSRRDKDTIWPIYTKLHGKCQIVGDVRVRVTDDGSLWWPKAKAVDTSETLWSGDTKTEKVAEGTEVKHPLVTPCSSKGRVPGDRSVP